MPGPHQRLVRPLAYMPSVTGLTLAVLLGAAQVMGDGGRVLFIGNSLTAWNDLPALVAEVGRAAGDRITCGVVAFPNFSLEDHWEHGAARRAIARGGWDVVVLQQGPSSLIESRRVLVQQVRRFDDEIRKAGAKTAVYMVWPAAGRRSDGAAVSQSYTAAARAVGAVLLPVGDAWRAAWRKDSRLPLYADDGFHPSPVGSWLGALVIYQQLRGAPSPAGPPPGLSSGQVDRLREAAAETVAGLARRR